MSLTGARSCPFCGENPECREGRFETSGDYQKQFVVECKNADCFIKPYLIMQGSWGYKPDHSADDAAKKEVLRRWNTRTSRAARERVAEFMLAHSIATGHGDTEEDLWSELGAAIREKDRIVATQAAQIKTLLTALRYAENTIVAMRPSFSQIKDEGYAYHDQTLALVRAALAAVGEKKPNAVKEQG